MNIYFGQAFHLNNQSVHSGAIPSNVAAALPHNAVAGKVSSASETRGSVIIWVLSSKLGAKVPPAVAALTASAARTGDDGCKSALALCAIAEHHWRNCKK
jgi:hypothetical protein